MNMKDKLRKCIDQIENMSQDEFNLLIKEKNINNIKYDINKYNNSEFKIITDYNNICNDGSFDVNFEFIQEKQFNDPLKEITINKKIKEELDIEILYSKDSENSQNIIGVEAA